MRGGGGGGKDERNRARRDAGGRYDNNCNCYCVHNDDAHCLDQGDERKTSINKGESAIGEGL